MYLSRVVRNTYSLLNTFKVGVGPSSSHTVGPMKIAQKFLELLKKNNVLTEVRRVKVGLYGSLALTGRGHGTDIAVLHGLEGQEPRSINTDTIRARFKEIYRNQMLRLGGHRDISFIPKRDLVFIAQPLPLHPNGMKLYAYDADGRELLPAQVYYSIGGGEIRSEEAMTKPSDSSETKNPPFESAEHLAQLCKKNNDTIAGHMLRYETQYRSEEEIKEGILEIAHVMNACIERGCQSPPKVLPGGLSIKRRAPMLFKQIVPIKHGQGHTVSHEEATLRLNAYAMAVNEENADFKRVVTAPTNGAAGIIPAIMRFMQEVYGKDTKEDMWTYFLTASAIRACFSVHGVSTSGAAMGCQGEVGVAASMAAAGLTAVRGGTTRQILNAAEIAMEHHLGLTCDPPKGLVQAPCIERNASGAMKAYWASMLVFSESKQRRGRISLDNVIKAMKEIGEAMDPKFKETAQGGLARFFTPTQKPSSKSCGGCSSSPRLAIC